jgi:hypothetical protein
MEIKLTIFINKRYEQNISIISKTIASPRNWSTKNDEQEDIRWRGGTHVGVGDAAVVAHVVVEVADVGKEVLVGEEVVGVRGVEEASSRTKRSPKILSPLSHTGSQEAGFRRPTISARGARRKTGRVRRWDSAKF